jgi:hypothetical protein
MQNSDSVIDNRQVNVSDTTGLPAEQLKKAGVSRRCCAIDCDRRHPTMGQWPQRPALWAGACAHFAASIAPSSKRV